LREDPTPHPLGLGGWRVGHFGSMKAGLFCVCESRVSYRSYIVFFRPTGGELRQLQSHVARHAHVSLRNAGNELRITVPVAMFGSNDYTTP